jgi:hypothetical protein
MSAGRAARRHPERWSAPKHKRDVIVTYVRPQMMDGQFAENLIDTITWDRDHDDHIWGRIGISSGPRIASARNQVMHHVRQLPPSINWIWNLDVDMTFNRQLLDRMYIEAHDRGITFLGALAFSGGRDFEIEPVLYEPSDDGMRRMRTYPKDTMMKVPATGAACILFHRDVLEDVLKLNPDAKYPWFEEVTDGDKEYGEDVTFCMRATEAGHPVHVHTGLQVGHMKTMPLHEGVYKKQFIMTGQQKRDARDGFLRIMGMTEEM